MIVKNDGNFLTGRQQPTLTQVVPEIFEGTKLKLCSPLMSNSLILELDALDQLPNCKAKLIVLYFILFFNSFQHKVQSYYMNNS